MSPTTTGRTDPHETRKSPIIYGVAAPVKTPFLGHVRVN